MAATTKTELEAQLRKLRKSLEREKGKSGKLQDKLTESLEQQAATGEILRVISRSPTDLQRTLQAILASAVRLCEAHLGLFYRFDGSAFTAVAFQDADPEFVEFLSRGPIRPGPKTALARLVAERRPIHFTDLTKDEAYRERDPLRVAQVELGGARTLLAVPMLKGREVLGAIVIYRPKVQPFTQRQIELVSTFADQAVIAIENVRLFNETKEALERQTATAEILRVISSSPADVQPVFEAIARNALAICGSAFANVFRYDGTLMHYAASHLVSPEQIEIVKQGYPAPPSRGRVAGRAILSKSVVCIEDALADPEYDRGVAAAAGWRRMFAVPMLREGEPLGAIAVGWTEPGPIAEAQQELLKTFADQAVIAIENVRLFNETKEALERQTATAEILKVISSSPRDLQPVFDAILEKAMRLCEAHLGMLSLSDGESYEHVAQRGASPEFARWAFRGPFVPDPRSSVGRLLRERKPIHHHDLRESIGYREGVEGTVKYVEIGGARSYMAVPMLKEGRVVGGIIIYRPEVRPFTEKQVELVATFANQAVIAIENVRLFKELEARTEALSRTVGQLSALGEVGQAVSSSLDLETVLRAIVSRAVQLTGLDAGEIFEYDEQAGLFTLRAAEKLDAEIAEALRKTPMRKGEGAVGRTAVTGEPAEIPEILDAGYQSRMRELLVGSGYRALLAVPLLREEHLLGAIVVNRKSAGRFAPEVVELLKRFATQSALAIQNARLFREIAEKGRQLELASQHKSQFLASMSHELRTPLNAILGFNEMLLAGIYGEVPADMKEPLADMQSSGKHLLRLINNVLDLAKIEAGRMELALADYSVPDLIEKVRATLKPLAAEKGLEFVTSVPGDVPLAHGDVGRMTQCLMNLAGNSLKFTKAGRVEIAVGHANGLLTYRVSDTGIGIAPEKIASLFTEFKQTDATIASEYGGSGLGLSIARKFVEMHRGRIWVESEPDKGSTFFIEMPLRAGGGAAA